MKPDQLYARLCVAPDATEEILYLITTIDYPAAVKKWTARGAAYGAAYDAALLAGVMVVRDLVERKHLDFALEAFCWWLNGGSDDT